MKKNQNVSLRHSYRLQCYVKSFFLTHNQIDGFDAKLRHEIYYLSVMLPLLRQPLQQPKSRNALMLCVVICSTKLYQGRRSPWLYLLWFEGFCYILALSVGIFSFEGGNSLFHRQYITFTQIDAIDARDRILFISLL